MMMILSSIWAGWLTRLAYLHAADYGRTHDQVHSITGSLCMVAGLMLLCALPGAGLPDLVDVMLWTWSVMLAWAGLVIVSMQTDASFAFVAKPSRASAFVSLGASLLLMGLV